MDSLSTFDNLLREKILLAIKFISDEEHKKAVEHEKALEHEKANECYRKCLEHFNKYVELSEKPPGYFGKYFYEQQIQSCPHLSDC